MTEPSDILRAVLSQVPFQPEGVNLPNKMTPGAWVIVAGVIACILAGIAFMLIRFFKATYVPWKKLAGSPLGFVYFAKAGALNEFMLLLACSRALELLVEYTTWKAADITRALRSTGIYVMDTPSWVDGPSGQKVAGLDPSGPAVVVGSDYAALLHELAHQCEEVIDRTVDYNHAGWDSKGIRKAEDEFAKWLSTQRVASGMTYPATPT